MKKPPFKANVKGIDWTFEVQTNATYRKRHGKDSSAITYLGDREVIFNRSHLSCATVRHEILHVWLASSSTNSANLTADQVEEMCAELFGDHGLEMITLADKVLDHFLK